jgi:hypothetical protein
MRNITAPVPHTNISHAKHINGAIQRLSVLKGQKDVLCQKVENLIKHPNFSAEKVSALSVKIADLDVQMCKLIPATKIKR